MEIYEKQVRDAKAVAPLVEGALLHKFKDVPKEEISIGVSEGLVSYCEAAYKRTLDNDDNPAGYIWRTGLRAIRKYLIHYQRETPMGDDEYENIDNDDPARYFEVKESLRAVLSCMKNKSYLEILQLHWVEELSFEEISAKQERSMKAVYNCHERAMHEAQYVAWRLGLRPPPQPQ